MQDTLESDLIARSKQGDQDAITELFRRHYAPCLRLAFGILRNPDDAQDAVQTGFLLAFRSLASFRGEGCFKTWISRIVMNSCFLQLRKVRRRFAIEGGNGMGLRDAHPSRTPTPEKSAWCRELSSAFSAAVAGLPKHLRETYTLFAISGLPLKEVAMLLGLTVSATKTRLFRARAGIRTSLRPTWVAKGAHSARI
jgi:RNA polymerase sigma-70 factor (ECF subfamily)